MRGVPSPPAPLIEERHSVPLILAQREDDIEKSEILCLAVTSAPLHDVRRN
jgi:hypothetical protein